MCLGAGIVVHAARRFCAAALLLCDLRALRTERALYTTNRLSRATLCLRVRPPSPSQWVQTTNMRVRLGVQLAPCAWRAQRPSNGQHSTPQRVSNSFSRSVARLSKPRLLPRQALSDTPSFRPQLPASGLAASPGGHSPSRTHASPPRLQGSQRSIVAIPTLSGLFPCSSSEGYSGEDRGVHPPPWHFSSIFADFGLAPPLQKRNPLPSSNPRPLKPLPWNPSPPRRPPWRFLSGQSGATRERRRPPKSKKPTQRLGHQQRRSRF